MVLTTGTASYASSGMMQFITGNSTNGHGGDVRMMVGTGDFDDGGDVLINAGETTSSKQTGGAIRMIAGTGSSPHFADGGDGGHFQIHGGVANGGKTSNDGGNVEQSGGYANSGYGGSIMYETGYGYATSSGKVVIASYNSGSDGVSGSISISTGTTMRSASMDR